MRNNFFRRAKDVCKHFGSLKRKTVPSGNQVHSVKDSLPPIALFDDYGDILFVVTSHRCAVYDSCCHYIVSLSKYAYVFNIDLIVERRRIRVGRGAAVYLFRIRNLPLNIGTNQVLRV